MQADEDAAPVDNREKFTGKAGVYARFRERYDAEAILPLLRAWCGLQPEWTVADVGTGTGVLGDVFRENGNTVIAVEPNEEMRALCAELHESDAQFRIVAGAAEETTLADGSVDMIATGRALHWFDAERAMREFKRILKPGGWVVIVAGGREEHGRAENEALEALFRAALKIHASTRASYAVYQRLGEFFAGGAMHHAEIPGEMQLDWEQLRGLALSHSHAPLPQAKGFPAFETGLRQLFERFQQNGLCTLATRCWINAGRFADSRE